MITRFLIKKPWMYNKDTWEYAIFRERKIFGISLGWKLLDYTNSEETYQKWLNTRFSIFEVESEG